MFFIFFSLLLCTSQCHKLSLGHCNFSDSFHEYNLERIRALSCHSNKNKAVLEPQVSPAFAITYFCNHCNIRFENTSKYVDTLTFFQKLEPKVIDP